MGCRYATIRGEFAGRKRRTTPWQQTDDDGKAKRIYSGMLFLVIRHQGSATFTAVSRAVKNGHFKHIR